MHTAANDGPSSESSVKETLTSIVIAFVVAFVFRGFVLEPFLIPTGSMAPTLMGAHMRFTGPDTGYSWAVGPWSYTNPRDAQTPERVQRNQVTGGPVTVHDPMSQQELTRAGVLSRSGDRIFVLKSLYNAFDPRRFEVIVFKNPSDPRENYIKRLVGLPGEQIAIVDGDIFARPLDALSPSAVREGPEAWSDTSWRIARKSERVQCAVWQPVFDSRCTPLSSLRGTSSTPFRPPWIGGAGWEIEGRLHYAFTGAGRTTLSWDDAARPVTDFCPYNELPQAPRVVFPVSDVRVTLAINPAAAGQSVAFVLRTRRHEFRAGVEGSRATIAMRPAPAEGQDPDPWRTLADEPLARELPVGEFTDLEFWHADQALALFVGGTRVAGAEYDWTPARRLEETVGSGPEANAERPPERTPLADPRNYPRPAVSIEFDGGGFELARVSLSRDLYYQPRDPGGNRLAFGATPSRMPTLNGDQFFVCGDNSGASLDARLWDFVDPWVSEQVDPTVGVVHRDLLVGRAFFVYFPAPVPTKNLWMPDFGRVRFIW